ncbi:MAG TPA: hypothetical protein VF039_04500 [Longimicrobiales bacterium]
MSWRETWRATVASFLREVRDPAQPASSAAPDALVDAIAAARREVAALEHQIREVVERAAGEDEAAADCARRAAQARRIADHDTAVVADRFGGQHRARAEVLARKQVVLRDELGLARAALNGLLDLARPEGLDA